MQSTPPLLPPGATLGEKNLLVGIISAAANDERRRRIRQSLTTTLPSVAPRWSYLFVTGRPGRPASVEGDTLYVDCPDTYESLPQKTLGLMRHLVEATNADYLLKMDDDCYLNARGLAAIRHWNRDYFGTLSGAHGHSRDYHFGKTSSGFVEDTTPYLGPWAHGTGYCVSRAGCRWLVDNISPALARASIYEDKMVGDAVGASPLARHLHSGFNAFKLDHFCEYELDAQRNVVASSIRLREDKPDFWKYVTYHLGGRGNAVDPIYRVDESTAAMLFERLDACLGPARDRARRG